MYRCQIRNAKLPTNHPSPAERAAANVQAEAQTKREAAKVQAEARAAAAKVEAEAQAAANVEIKKQVAMKIYPACAPEREFWEKERENRNDYKRCKVYAGWTMRSDYVKEGRVCRSENIHADAPLCEAARVGEFEKQRQACQ